MFERIIKEKEKKNSINKMKKNTRRLKEMNFDSE